MGNARLHVAVYYVPPRQSGIEFTYVLHTCTMSLGLVMHLTDWVTRRELLGIS